MAPPESGSSIGDRDEHRVLLLGHALHRVHQIGNQVRPPLQLGLDLPLSLVHPLVQRLDLIVSAAGQKQSRGEEG